MAKLLPEDCIAWDSIERRLDGLKRHLHHLHGLASHCGFALGVKHLSSQQACLAWQLHQVLFPLRCVGWSRTTVKSSLDTSTAL